MRQVGYGLLFVFALLFIQSCGRPYRLDREDLAVGSAWPFARGESDGRGAVETGSFTAGLDVVWENKSGDKPVGPLTVHHGVLVYPSSKKRIKFYDLQSGRYEGRLKARGIPQTGLVIQDSVAYYCLSPKQNHLYGKNLINGKTLLKVVVKDAAPGSIIVNNRLLVSSGEGVLSAYDLDTREETWRFSAKGKFVAPATFGAGRLLQPNDRGILHILSLEDGSKVFDVETEGPLVSAVAVTNVVYATDVLGHVYGIDPGNGNTIWRAKLDGPIWSSPTVAHRKVFVGHSGGELVALDADSGMEIWRFKTVEVIKAPPLVVDDYVVVGTMAGTLIMLKASDGREVARQTLKGAIAYPPVTDGRRVYVATQLGRIVCLGKRDDQLSQTDY